MRVNKQNYARRIKATLRDWDVVCDREEATDCIIYNFSRLHGIGVAVKELEDSNKYMFMYYPYTDCMYDGYYETTSVSTTVEFVKRWYSVRTAGDIRGILQSIEHGLHLPHWEDYLEEKPKDKEPTAKDFVELGKAIGEGMVAGLKHENPVTSSVWTDSSKYVVDRISDELKEQIKTMLNSVYGKPTKHDDRPDTAMYYLASRGFGKTNWALQQALAYCKNDVKITRDLADRLTVSSCKPKVTLSIAEVIFHDPATIIIWRDGTKTVVKAQDGETYDPEKGLAMAICKKAMGNTRDYYIPFKKYLKQWKKEHPEKDTVDVFDAVGNKVATLVSNPEKETADLPNIVMDATASFYHFAQENGLNVSAFISEDELEKNKYEFQVCGKPEKGYYQIETYRLINSCLFEVFTNEVLEHFNNIPE